MEQRKHKEEKLNMKEEIKCRNTICSTQIMKYKRESRSFYFWIIPIFILSIFYHFIAIIGMLLFFAGMVIYNEQRDISKDDEVTK